MHSVWLYLQKTSLMFLDREAVEFLTTHYATLGAEGENQVWTHSSDRETPKKLQTSFIQQLTSVFTWTGPFDASGSVFGQHRRRDTNLLWRKKKAKTLGNQTSSSEATVDINCSIDKQSSIDMKPNAPITNPHMDRSPRWCSWCFQRKSLKGEIPRMLCNFHQCKTKSPGEMMFILRQTKFKITSSFLFCLMPSILPEIVFSALDSWISCCLSWPSVLFHLHSCIVCCLSSHLPL